jgi:(2Fe-2S) ferredoxin
MNHRTAEMREQGVSDHVLVCTNTRESDYPCCAEASGQDVLERVKDWLREREIYWSRVRVAETSCLGLCSADGTALAIHPRNRWHSDVRPDDVPDLLRAEFGSSGERLGLGPEPAED